MTAPAKSMLWTVPIFLVYVALAIYLSARHEVWRDEARALSIARQASDPFDLVQTQLLNEGHPGLWHLLLWLGWHLSGNTAVLKVISVLIAVAFSALFFFRSPFPLLHRCLFLFGVLPLFMFSAIARNYGISAVFLFLLADASDNARPRSPWLIGFYNALLANTNIYGTFCAIGLLIPSWSARDATAGQALRTRGIVSLATIAGVLLTLYTVWPNADNIASVVQEDEGSAVVELPHAKALALLPHIALDRDNWTAFFFSGREVGDLEKFYPQQELLRYVGAVGLLLIALVFWRSPALLATFAFVYICAGLFSQLVYGAQERHLGVLAMFLLTLLWMQRLRQAERRMPFTPLVLTGLAVVLMAHIHAAYTGVDYWLRNAYSQSSSAGHFLSANYPEAIVICQPDYFAEPLPYYCNNSIYIMREQRIGDHCLFTKTNNRSITLDEVIAAAERLAVQTGKPVLVALNQHLAASGDDQLWGAWGRNLVMPADQLERFHERFVEVASFYGGYENYVFYLFQPKGN